MLIGTAIIAVFGVAATIAGALSGQGQSILIFFGAPFLVLVISLPQVGREYVQGFEDAT
jgi:hypothetical protein